MRVYYEATLDYAGVSLVDEGESSAGLVVSGRFLASVRAPGEPTPSATWRGDVPDDGTASISSVSIYRTGGGGSLSQEARKLESGAWQAQVQAGLDALLQITDPTQALADVVASTVRPAD